MTGTKEPGDDPRSATSVRVLIDHTRLVVNAIKNEDEVRLRAALGAVAEEAGTLAKTDPLLPTRGANRVRVAAGRGALPPR